MSVLFVCTGNICRSAAAELLWSARSSALPQPLPPAYSAGTRAVSGRPVHPWTAAALDRRGVPTAGFAASRLSGDDVTRADLVLTMTTRHREAVLALDPRSLRRTFTLREAGRLASALPHDLLAGAHPDDRLARLADALADVRAIHRPGARDSDITDPIEGPARVHATAVDDVARALDPLIALLDRQTMPDDTVRMDRLPPVPLPA
jgi:protein-tyrosine phosphatase